MYYHANEVAGNSYIINNNGRWATPLRFIKLHVLVAKGPVEPVAVITLRPARAQSRKKVVWTEDTVDNENMNKKKSKCCCIYEKPRRFDESDSESSDDECEHCFGHVEHKRHKRQAAETTTQLQEASETTTEVTLHPKEESAEDPPPPPTVPST